jgi:hypothetical protein
MSKPPSPLKIVPTSGNKSGDSSDRGAKGKMRKPSKFFYDHCKKEGHSRDHCWVLHPHLRPVKGRSTEAHVVVFDNHSDVQSQLNQFALYLQKLLETQKAVPEKTKNWRTSI